jgi:hypothetical protein
MRSHRLAASVVGGALLALALPSLALVAADPPAKPTDASAAESPLTSEQRQVADRFKELEKLLLRMAELTAPSDPRRAALLRQAVAQSKKRDIDHQFDELLDLLRQQRLATAVKGQGELQQDLNRLLELLLSEDRSKRIESEKERIRDYLKRVNKIIKEQKATQAETAREAEARELAERQGELAEKTGELAGDVGQDAAKKPAGDSKPGEQPEGEDAQGDEKPGEPKSDKPSGDYKKSEKEKPADQGEKEKSGEKKNESEKGDSKPGEPQKGESEKGEQGSKGQKPAKPGDSKSQPGKPGEPQDAPGEEDGSESQSQPESGENSPAQKRLEQAQKRMKEAQQKLEEANKSDALEKQAEALKELEQAKADLEEILRQLREEEMTRTLAMLETRFRKMLDAQVEVYEATQRLDQKPDSERDRDSDIEAGRLSRKEAQIAAEADKALAVLREEGSAVAFPEAVVEMREDMLQVTKRLAESKVGEVTQGLETDIIAALEEMIASLKQAQKDLEKSKQQQSGPPGEQGDPPLVDTLAELKMIRVLQMRVNVRTERYAKLTESEQKETAELIEALKRLAEREQKIHQVTRDIVVGRNQ